MGGSLITAKFKHLFSSNEVFSYKTTLFCTDGVRKDLVPLLMLFDQHSAKGLLVAIARSCYSGHELFKICLLPVLDDSTFMSGDEVL